MRLGPPDHDAVVAALDDMDEHVGIGLFGRALAAIALHVCHGPTDDEVLVLDDGQPVLEPLVVASPMGGVDVVGDGVPGVDGIHADATLKAGPGELTEPALHLVLGHHVIGAACHMQEPVDGFAGQLGLLAGQFRLLDDQVIGGGHRIDRGSDDGVIDRLDHPLSEQPHVQIPPAQALDVVGAVANRIAGGPGGFGHALSLSIEATGAAPLVL